MFSQNGRGTMHYATDKPNVYESYEGDWVDGIIHGHGKYTYSDGAVYEGTWVEGKMQGKGKLTNEYGNIYEGEFYNDLKHGFGVLHCINGEKYEVFFACAMHFFLKLSYN